MAVNFLSVTALLLSMSTLLHQPNKLEATGGFSVDLIHHYSPHSPLYNSKIRNSMWRAINDISATPDGGFKSKVIPNNGVSYLMPIYLGTPPVRVPAVVDTGRNLIWTQCKPCKKCYKQDAPYFDPNASSAYRELPFTSKSCLAALGTWGFCSSENSCNYNHWYEDGSFSKGVLAVETFSMTSTNGRSLKIRNVVMGCGHNNNGTFTSNEAGIVGLGGGLHSFISQLGSSIDGKFAYWLAPSDQDNSHMDFGDTAVVSGKGVVSTPIIYKPEDFENYFYVTLETISVGNKSVSLPSAEKGNIMIDSGSTLTSLPPLVYQELMSMMKEAIKDHVPLATKDPSRDFELCYEHRFDFKVPDLKFGFDGAQVVLTTMNTFIPAEGNLYRAAFKPSEDVSIYGNVAQRNFRIG